MVGEREFHRFTFVRNATHRSTKGAIQLGGRKETVASPDWVVGRAGFRKHDRDFRQMLVALRDPFLTQEVEAARLKLFPYDETSGKSSLFT